jgi:hypothetical protein
VLQYGSLGALILSFVPVSVCLNEWWVFGCTPIIGAFFIVQGIHIYQSNNERVIKVRLRTDMNHKQVLSIGYQMIPIFSVLQLLMLVVQHSYVSLLIHDAALHHYIQFIIV